MPNWMMKAAVQGCIARLPRNYLWNGLFQQHVTKTLRLDEAQFRFKLMECREHVVNYQACTSRHVPFTTVLELGTGWHPVLPLGFYLCGASEVWTFDIRPLLRTNRVAETARSFLDLAEEGSLPELLPWVRPERLDGLRRLLARRAWSSANQMLEEIGIYVRVADVRDAGIKESSTDFIMSNGTLQHVPRHTLRGIFAEFRRVASPHTIMSHQIVLADPFSGSDPSVSPFNHLRYSSAKWRLINNSLIFQNRLRLSDYRRLHRESGFEILRERNREGSPADLDGIPLAPEFQDYSREDLLVVRTWLTSRPSTAA